MHHFHDVESNRYWRSNMYIPYHPRTKAIVDGMATHILSRLGQSARLRQVCSGIGAVFCRWTLCHKEQRSTQLPTAQLYGSSPKSIAKQTVRHVVKRCFEPPR
ncbi:hypothetical protein TNCT_651181 [Trichonephila clavata]|uniref:Uncharacterized protein n=1 Tax=Trichonephila clavata TaxID=2740835 RepID=A0A8X6L7W9_TRICU|nr:hypothetical protein TNCT_651181 [Trichonephila clavata]